MQNELPMVIFLYDQTSLEELNSELRNGNVESANSQWINSISNFNLNTVQLDEIIKKLIMKKLFWVKQILYTNIFVHVYPTWNVHKSYL